VGGGTSVGAETHVMAALPDLLDRKTHVELSRRDVEAYVRRAILLVFVGISAAGLANVFGQHTRTLSVDSDAAKLTIEAPHAARGGLIYQARFRVDAHRDLAKPTLVLDPGWFDGLTINTVEPDAVTWGQIGGRNTVELPPISAGDHFVLRLQYQVNPTVIGHRVQNVLLEEAGAPIVTLRHAQTIFP
jgi:hypothetical protein